VHVYERFDEIKRGKGYALSWILQQLEEDYDAYIILDADSVVELGFLQAMEKELAQGAQAMQAFNTVLNISESPSTALRWIALSLINHVRPLGRNGLGASSTLTGNGMCLSRTLLTRHPWQAFGLTEDYQYYLTIVQHGERVRYVPEAVVRSHMPTKFAQMRIQDVRWEGSKLEQTKWQIALKLLSKGLRFRDFVRIEAIAELLTPPLSVLVGSCLLTLIASFSLWSLPDLLLSLILIGGLVCYVATPLYLLRPPHTVYMALLYAPRFMAWKLWVYFVLRRSTKHTNEWISPNRSLVR
jgi:cellulose synthase/poly-beta-1,6-N-acetylglucosamine synthase-like glycosyltransferase